MALLQQLQQPALRDVAIHLPWPKRCRPSIARDLGERVSPGAVAFDRDYLDGLTAIGIVSRKQAGGFADPTFAGE
jgi:hypothetical protein